MYLFWETNNLHVLHLTLDQVLYLFITVVANTSSTPPHVHITMWLPTMSWPWLLHSPSSSPAPNPSPSSFLSSTLPLSLSFTPAFQGDIRTFYHVTTYWPWSSLPSLLMWQVTTHNELTMITSLSPSLSPNLSPSSFPSAPLPLSHSSKMWHTWQLSGDIHSFPGYCLECCLASVLIA